MDQKKRQLSCDFKMKLWFLGVFAIFGHLDRVVIAKKNQVESVYYWKRVIFDDLPYDGMAFSVEKVEHGIFV